MKTIEMKNVSFIIYLLVFGLKLKICDDVEPISLIREIFQPFQFSIDAPRLEPLMTDF